MAATYEKSEHFESLGKEDKKGYWAKLTLSTGEQLPDPSILHSNWPDYVSLFPDISVTYPNICHYLIEYPSQFSKESLKAHKSLESFNFFVSRHAQNVYYRKVEKKSKFCFIKSRRYVSIKFRKDSSLYAINYLRSIFSYSKHRVNILVN